MEFLYYLTNPLEMLQEFFNEWLNNKGILIAGVMGALYFLSAEEDLDWEALLGDDDEEE